jgi:hypothetical protein
LVSEYAQFCLLLLRNFNIPKEKKDKMKGKRKRGKGDGC